jgi:hypothetical protein
VPARDETITCVQDREFVLARAAFNPSRAGSRLGTLPGAYRLSHSVLVKLGLFMAVGLVCACGLGSPEDDGFPPSGVGMGLDGGEDDDADSGGARGDDECQGSQDCMDAFCVGPYDPVTQVRGIYQCVPTCVEAMDETRWCSDDAACCDPGARCSARGYCEVDPPGATDTDTDTAGSMGSESSETSGSDGTDSDTSSTTG